MVEEKKSITDVLLKLNVNDYTEKKNGLTYLSWAFAWQKILEIDETANYVILKNEDGLPYFGSNSMGYMVFTTITINGTTREMWLPVMDGANKSLKDDAYEYSTKYGKKSVEAINMFDVNKTIMRCLVKNLAMFGLGLYIYAGEDLPEESNEEDKSKSDENKNKQSKKDKPQTSTPNKSKKDTPKPTQEDPLKVAKSKIDSIVRSKVKEKPDEVRKAVSDVLGHTDYRKIETLDQAEQIKVELEKL